MYKKGTVNYNLPQWEALEHPDFLDDMNPAYSVIDEKLHKAETGSDDALKQLTTLTPIVEGLNVDMDDVQHDVTDLQTRCTNLEHTQLDHENRIKSLEQHDTDIDKTLVGFDETNTVLAEFNKTNASINDVKQSVSDIKAKDTYLFDGMEYATNKYVGEKNVKRKSGTLTVLPNPSMESIELATIPAGVTIFSMCGTGTFVANTATLTAPLTGMEVIENKLSVNLTNPGGDFNSATINFTVEYY